MLATVKFIIVVLIRSVSSCGK